MTSSFRLRKRLANGRSNLEERLARWLLMAQDRIGRSEVRLPQVSRLSCLTCTDRL
jgi:hypothetical protein